MPPRTAPATRLGLLPTTAVVCLVRVGTACHRRGEAGSERRHARCDPRSSQLKPTASISRDLSRGHRHCRREQLRSRTTRVGLHVNSGAVGARRRSGRRSAATPPNYGTGGGQVHQPSPRVPPTRGDARRQSPILVPVVPGFACLPVGSGQSFYVPKRPRPETRTSNQNTAWRRVKAGSTANRSAISRVRSRCAVRARQRPGPG